MQQKSRKPDVYTPVNSINTGERSVCVKYISLSGATNNNSIVVKYSINITMTTFNLFE
jgi:hypothetical protein